MEKMDKQFLLTIVSIILILVGMQLTAKFENLQHSANQMTDTIMAPLDDLNYLIDHPFEESITFDSNEYVQESFYQATNFSFETLKFERSLAAGITCILAGLTLFFIINKATINDFFVKTFRFFL